MPPAKAEKLARGDNKRLLEGDVLEPLVLQVAGDGVEFPEPVVDDRPHRGYPY